MRCVGRSLGARMHRLLTTEENKKLRSIYDAAVSEVQKPFSEVEEMAISHALREAFRFGRNTMIHDLDDYDEQRAKEWAAFRRRMKR